MLRIVTPYIYMYVYIYETDCKMQQGKLSTSVKKCISRIVHPWIEMEAGFDGGPPRTSDYFLRWLDSVWRGYVSTGLLSPFPLSLSLCVFTSSLSLSLVVDASGRP
jgi:hypothetical protein